MLEQLKRPSGTNTRASGRPRGLSALTWLQMRSYWPLKKRDRTPAFSTDLSSLVTPSPSHLNQSGRRAAAASAWYNDRLRFKAKKP